MRRRGDELENPRRGTRQRRAPNYPGFRLFPDANPYRRLFNPFHIDINLDELLAEREQEEELDLSINLDDILAEHDSDQELDLSISAGSFSDEDDGNISLPSPNTVDQGAMNDLIDEVVNHPQRFYRPPINSERLHGRFEQLNQDFDRTGRVRYRVLSEAFMPTIPPTVRNPFHRAVQYQPEFSAGTELLTNVVSAALHATLDIANLQHNFNGRMHVLLMVHSNALIDPPGVIEDPMWVQDDNGQWVNMLWMTNTVEFSIQSLRNSSFATLSVCANDSFHNTFIKPIKECMGWFGALLGSGALGGYPSELIALRFSHYALEIGSRFAGNRRVQKLPKRPLTEFWQSEEELRAIGEELQDMYVNVIDTMLGDRDGNYEGEEEDGEDEDGNPIFNREAGILKRVQRITLKLFPRAVFINKRLDITSWPRTVIQNDADLAANPIERTPNSINSFHRRRDDVAAAAASTDDPLWRTEPLQLGCIISRADKLENALQRLTQLWSPPNSLDNNCFIDCLRESTSRKFVDRAELGIHHGDHITENEMFAIAQERQETYFLYTIRDTPYHEKTLMMQTDPEEARISQTISFMRHVNGMPQEPSIENHHFLVHHNHCYLIKNLPTLLKKVKCSTCSQWINRDTFKRHIDKCRYCQQCRRAYHTLPHECKPSDRCKKPSEKAQDRIELSKPTTENSISWINMDTAPLGKKITPANKIWFADLEAFPNATGEFIPYAAGLFCLGSIDDMSKVEIFYGPECMTQFFKRLDEIQGSFA